MDAVRTPLATAPALELGNKLWRKEILKQGPIHYNGGKFDANAEYLDAVLAAYKDGAIGSVPFVFVDDHGAHLEGPERRKGNIVGLERTPTGLDAIVALDDDAEALVQKDRKFGVSVLIKHNRTTGNGKHYPAVLAHVAGTYDPVLNDLGDWKQLDQIAASNDVTDVLDLLALTSAPQDEPNKEKPMADAATPTAEELATLRSLLAKFGPVDIAVTNPDGTPKVDDTTDPKLTDEELQKLADDVINEGEPVEQPELIAASNEDGGEGGDSDVLALSHRLAVAEQARRDDALALAQVRDELDERNYLTERDRLARKHGIHPSVTDIVKPLLKGTGQKLALANGQDVDPGALIRQFIDEIATRPRLDLSQAKGSALDVDDNDPAAHQRDLDAFLAQAKAELNH